MYKYVLRRLLLAVPVLLLSSVIVFGLMRVMPGDALTALMGESGNVSAKELPEAPEGPGPRPAVPRAVLHLALADGELQPRLLHLHQRAHRRRPGQGDPRDDRAGRARHDPRAGHRRSRRRALGDPPGQAADYVGRVVAVSGLSLPDFWLGTLVITFAAIWFRWMPPLGYASLWDDPIKNLQQFLLPAAVLGFRLSAATMRMTRSTVLEVLREDYVRTAWAKGLGGTHRRLQARAQERPHPGRHHRGRPARDAPRGHGDRGDDLRACPAWAG